MIVTGDFNAQTGVVYQKCLFDSESIVVDKECNDNGSRLKRFFREQRFCQLQTFFNHPLENRITWYSNDGVTRKIIDYVLVEMFIQQYITECIVMPEYDFESDHRIIITHMNTPKTRRARRNPKQIPNKTAARDLKSLSDKTVEESFITAVKASFTASREDRSATKIFEAMTSTLKDAAEHSIPPKQNKSTRELWKDDGELNNLISLRSSVPRNSEEYKEQTKRIKNE